MLGKTNAGGGAKLFAAIAVTYPAGSSLTCTKGTKTLTAKTSTGQWIFAVPEAGTWTVTVTSGSSTNSQNVDITSEGQSVNITLSLELLLFDSSVTSGWASKLYNASFASAGIANGKLTVKNSASAYSGALLYKEEPVSTSGYTNAKITVDSVKTANGTDSKHASLILQTSPALGSMSAVAQAAARLALTGPGTFTLKLPEGTYYVGIEVGQNEVTVSKIWFE
ncbi:MAG: hypothetical protein IJE09_06285 [Oscillospiraceae bacterium]|nr:hypothetical protein [Oscillospiraceae bacterium]